MGFVTCGIHTRRRCCWQCDRCPKCDNLPRLRRGDYCADCTDSFKRRGFPWCDWCQNYHFDGRPPHDRRGHIPDFQPALRLNTPEPEPDVRVRFDSRSGTFYTVTNEEA